ncbi:MAG TPA: 50S ribosomal protein L13 [Candidatus Omnitrophica bacterium]|nr:50S ribosomal protein L13 [Candidatus Omnitrophota bacterium]
MKTSMPKKEKVDRKWYLVNAEGKTLGRLASRVSLILQGKHKPSYTPHLDMGDFVVVINADKVRVTGKKFQDKKYRSHSGYPGKLKEKSFGELLETKPEEVINRAVRGMLPKNKLGRAMIKKLKVYRGDEHPHQAQRPEVLNIIQ